MSYMMNKDEIMSYLQEAISLHNEGELPTAEAIYRHVLEVDENNFHALRFLGCLCRLKKSYQEGIYLLERAVLLKPYDADCLYNLGNILADSGDFKRAIQVLHKCIYLRADFAQAMVTLGWCFSETGELSLSIDLLLEAVSLDPFSSQAWLNLGNSYKETGKFSEAILTYRKAITLLPDFAELYLNLGVVLIEDCQFEEAMASYRMAIQVKPDFADAYLNLGNLLKEENDVEDAIASYRKAIELKPDSPDAYFNLGNILDEQGEVQEVIVCYRKAIDLKPDYVDALSALASILCTQKEYVKSISLYLRVLEIDEDNVNANAGLGWTFLKSGFAQKAQEYYTCLLRHKPGNADALFFLFESFKGSLHEKLTKNFSYSDQFLDITLNALGVSRIVAFGDSHVKLFGECRYIEVMHVGASTAYNLLKDDSSTRGREKVLNRVSRMDPKSEAVLLCFGEVDLRANILKYCYRKQISIKESVSDVITRYLDFASEITNRGFQLLIYGGYGVGSDRISYGSDAERNYASACLQAGLRDACRKMKIVYFSLDSCFFDATTFTTDSRFLVDNFHLYADGKSFEEIQLLLFEHMSRSSLACSSALLASPSSQIVLGNVGCDSNIFVGSLSDGLLSWSGHIDSLRNVVFNMNSVISISSITLTFDSEFDLNVDFLSLNSDGRPFSVNLVRVNSFSWCLRPPKRYFFWACRYPMLIANPSILESLKGVLIEVKSLV